MERRELRRPSPRWPWDIPRNTSLPAPAASCFPDRSTSATFRRCNPIATLLKRRASEPGQRHCSNLRDECRRLSRTKAKQTIGIIRSEKKIVSLLGMPPIRRMCDVDSLGRVYVRSAKKKRRRKHPPALAVVVVDTSTLSSEPQRREKERKIGMSILFSSTNFFLSASSAPPFTHAGSTSSREKCSFVRSLSLRICTGRASLSTNQGFGKHRCPFDLTHDVLIYFSSQQEKE